MHKLSFFVVCVFMAAQVRAGQANVGVLGDTKEKPVYKTPEQWQKEHGSMNVSDEMKQNKAQQELAQAQKELDEAQNAFAKATEKLKETMASKP